MPPPENNCTQHAAPAHFETSCMQCQCTPRDLPRLHSADKSFSFALNYQKYFPKAPGSASKSFYRQKIEAQWAERENEEKEDVKAKGGRNEKQQTVEGGRSHASSLQTNNGPTLSFSNSNTFYVFSHCFHMCWHIFFWFSIHSIILM